MGPAFSQGVTRSSKVEQQRAGFNGICEVGGWGSIPRGLMYPMGPVDTPGPFFVVRHVGRWG